MFTDFPTYSPYRTLHLTSPVQRGEDVYAMQTALDALGWTVSPDGILGQQTASAIRRTQADLRIVVDGLAGGGTQMAITKELANRAQAKHSLPHGLVFGQCMHESGCRLGNYSPRRADGSYDAGVAQRNTAFTKPEVGFDAPASVEALGFNSRKYFDKYLGVTDTRRRWSLAAGAWNAPAFANWIARDEGASKVATRETLKPGPTARLTIEAYMASATAYLVVP